MMGCLSHNLELYHSNSAIFIVNEIISAVFKLVSISTLHIYALLYVTLKPACKLKDIEKFLGTHYKCPLHAV